MPFEQISKELRDEFLCCAALLKFASTKPVYIVSA